MTVMTKSEILENLELIKSQIEWEYPLDYYVALEEAIRIVQEAPEGHWKDITAVKNRQTQKGISTYGQILEENKTLSLRQILEYALEEHVDGAMYTQHAIKMLDDMEANRNAG